jgi:hypothetical protein
MLCRMPRRSRSRSSESSSRSRNRSRRLSRSRRLGSRRSRSPSPRRTVRARSRSQSGGLERSVSRELYAEEKPKLTEIHKLVQSQQDLVYTLLKEHKEEVDEKLMAKNRRFASKQLEKQFQVNLKFKELVSKIQQAHSDKEWKKWQVRRYLNVKLIYTIIQRSGAEYCKKSPSQEELIL